MREETTGLVGWWKGVREETTGLGHNLQAVLDDLEAEVRVYAQLKESAEGREHAHDQR